MTFVESMKDKAKEKAKKLVLPEGTEPRTIKAAQMLAEQKLAAEVVLVGDTEKIRAAAAEEGVSLDQVKISDPATSDLLDEFAKEYYELRKHKGLTEDQAKVQITDPLKWGAMMVRLSYSDAMVAGADNPTGKVLVAGFTIIKTAPGVKSASSCFVMDIPDKKWGSNGLMIFSDCATIPDPSAEQLAEIAAQASDSCEKFIGAEPVTALLSFSTKGSASHPMVDKVTEALAICKERYPDIKIDGELQLDAAIVGSVAAKKAPDSDVAGNANTLVFPDLQSGNIGYKLVQRLAGAEAYGPFLQGFAKPISDLSRGCSVEDIVSTSAITLCQCN